jgi:hypothetical protein
MNADLWHCVTGRLPAVVYGIAMFLKYVGAMISSALFLPALSKMMLASFSLSYLQLTLHPFTISPLISYSICCTV